MTVGTTADLGLAWALKRSFLGYIAGVGDGEVTVADGAALTSTQEFFFPWDPVDDDASTDPRFAGLVRFSAHHGFLTLALRRPRVRFDAPGIARVEIAADDGTYRVLATIHDLARITDSSVLMLRGDDVRLSATAVDLFGHTYGADEPLEPITLRIPHAGERR